MLSLEKSANATTALCRNAGRLMLFLAMRGSHECVTHTHCCWTNLRVGQSTQKHSWRETLVTAALKGRQYSTVHEELEKGQRPQIIRRDCMGHLGM